MLEIDYQADNSKEIHHTLFHPALRPVPPAELYPRVEILCKNSWHWPEPVQAPSYLDRDIDVNIMFS